LIDARKLRRSYKHKISNFHKWEQKPHASSYLLYPQNTGPFLSIDEVSLSKGEIYTYVTNKEAKGKKGTLVASIKGTLSQDIIRVLNQIPLEQRKQVKEVTLDMANNMSHAVKMSFPNAMQTTDHFHVIKLAMEALQHIRVKYRWEEMDKENLAIKQAKEKGEKYKPTLLSNEDTPKQLLARCRYVIVKKSSEWTQSQEERAKLLFKRYPTLKKAYYHVLQIRALYKHRVRADAQRDLVCWLLKTKEINIKEFNTVANTLNDRLETILNFFEYRNTNANAESFNAKIKLFRANLRGVTDVNFFLFRLEKLFA
jgi:transposase